MARNKSTHKSKYNAQKFSAELKQSRITRIDKSAHPTWKFEHIEIYGKFSLSACPDLDLKTIILVLKGLEGLTWYDIESATHDRKNKSKHHTIDIEKLTKEGELAYNKKFKHTTQPDELFSLALNNLMRLLGYRKDSSFYIIWIDPNHEFVKTKYNS